MEIVRTILPMANSLRLDVIAEGVETAEQLAILRNSTANLDKDIIFQNPSPPRKRKPS